MTTFEGEHDFDNLMSYKCSICKETHVGYGNNARPVNKGTCCDECNKLIVIPERIRELQWVFNTVTIVTNT